VEIITRQTLANDAVNQWANQYRIGKGPVSDSEKVETYSKLKSLGNHPDPNSVDKIIGNGSWTRVPFCSECGSEDNDFVISIADADESMELCEDCIDKIHRMVKEYRGVDRCIA